MSNQALNTSQASQKPMFQRQGSNQSLHTSVHQKQTKNKKWYIYCTLEQHEQEGVHAHYINSIIDSYCPFVFLCKICYQGLKEDQKINCIFIDELIKITSKGFQINNWPNDHLLNEPIQFIKQKEAEIDQLKEIDLLFSQLERNFLEQLARVKQDLKQMIIEEHKNSNQIIESLKKQINQTFEIQKLKDIIDQLISTKGKTVHHHQNTTNQSQSRINVSQSRINGSQQDLNASNLNATNNSQSPTKKSTQQQPHHHHHDKRYQKRDQLVLDLKSFFNKERKRQVIDIVDYYHHNVINTKRRTVQTKNFFERQDQIMLNLDLLRSKVLPVIPRMIFNSSQHNESEKRIFIDGNIVRMKGNGKGTVLLSDSFHKTDHVIFNYKITKCDFQSCWYTGVTGQDEDTKEGYCYFSSGNQICMHCKNNIVSKHGFKLTGSFFPEIYQQNIIIKTEICIAENYYKQEIVQDSINLIDSNNNIEINKNYTPKNASKLKHQQSFKIKHGQLQQQFKQSIIENEYDFQQDCNKYQKLDQWHIIFQTQNELHFEILQFEKISDKNHIGDIPHKDIEHQI